MTTRDPHRQLPQPVSVAAAIPRQRQRTSSLPTEPVQEGIRRAGAATRTSAGALAWLLGRTRSTLFTPEWTPPTARLLRLGVILALVPVQLLVGGTLAYRTAFSDRVYPNVAVADLDLGGATRDQATAELRAYVNTIAQHPVELRGADHTVTVTLGELGVSAPDTDINAIVDHAWRAARADQSTADWLRAQITLHQYGERLALPITVNTEQATQRLTDLAQQIDRPAVDAHIELVSGPNGVTPQLKNAQAGRQLNVEATLARFQAAMRDAQSQGTFPASLDLVITTTPPRVQDAEMQASQGQLAQTLATPLTFTGLDNAHWQLTPDQLATVVQASTSKQGSVTIDDAKLRDLVNGIADQAEASPSHIARNAQLTLQGDRVAIEPDQEGWHVDRDAAVKAAKAHLLSGDHNVTLPIIKDKPAITKDALASVRDWANARLAQPITLDYNGHPLTLSSHDLAGMLDLPNIPSTTAPTGEAAAPTPQVPGMLHLNDFAVRQYIADYVTPWTGLDPKQAGEDPLLEISGGQVVIRPGRAGQGIDVDRLANDIATAFSNTGSRTVRVNLVTRQPRTNTGNLMATRDAANRLIRPITIRSPLGDQQLTSVQLAAMLHLPGQPGEQPTLDRSKLTAYVQALAKGEATDKQSGMNVITTTAVREGRTAMRLDVQSTTDAILAQAQTDQRDVEVQWQP